MEELIKKQKTPKYLKLRIILVGRDLQDHRRRQVLSTWAEPPAQDDSGVRLQKLSRNKHQGVRGQEPHFHPTPHNTEHDGVPGSPGTGKDTEKG